MDEALDKSWKNSSQPFDGETLSFSDLLPLSALRNLMVQVLDQLKRRFPRVTLQQFDDWHQHDGYTTSPQSSSWEGLEQILRSDEILYENRSPDDYIRKSFYPTTKTFLFRFYVADKDNDPEFYPGVWGDFDLSAHPSLIAEIVTELHGEGKDKLIVLKSKPFFDNNYAG